MRRTGTRLAYFFAKILMIAGLAFVCLWLGLGRGYQDGMERGAEYGYAVGYKAGHRMGWHMAADELGEPSLPAPPVYPHLTSNRR